ncbi:MAG TPA: VWA domain-containing protein [Thermoanaerobaculia bacterium]|jgi:VWFA-related protein
MRKKLLASLFVAFAALTASAQDAPRAGETIEVSIVNVDVVVTDRAGNRVRGLKKEDFELRENGKVQPISNFAEYVSRAEQGTLTADVAEGSQAQTAPREKRTLLIFFEQLQLTKLAADSFENALRETIDRLMGPGDEVSVVIWSPSETRHVEFTSDRTKIATAIADIKQEALGARPDMKSVQRREIADRKALAEMGDIPTPAGTDPLGDVQLPMLMAYNEMVVRVGAINSAIHSMAGAEGRKMLLLATNRLGQVAGAEFAYETGVKEITPYLKTRFNTDRLMRSVIDNANANGVTIYPVNPPGLAKDTGDTEYYDHESLDLVTSRGGIEHLTLLNESISLEKIAKETGGLMAIGPKRIVDLLPRIVSDASDYYSLAYRVTFSGADRARNITVKTRNPEYQVRTRTQFVEKSDETRMRDRLQSTLFRVSQNGATIKIRAAAREVKKGRNTSTMQVRVRIPIADLTLLPKGNGKHGGSFAVYVGAASDLDELSEVTRKTQQFEVTESELAQARTGHFTYDVNVDVRQKSKYLAVGVYDETAKTFGVARVELTK